MPKKEPGYGEAMKELESIIEEIESEGIDVDVLAGKVRRASYLIGLCRGKLRDTEGEVRKILEGLEKEQLAGGVESDEEDGPEGGDESSRGGGLF